MYFKYVIVKQVCIFDFNNANYGESEFSEDVGRRLLLKCDFSTLYLNLLMLFHPSVSRSVLG